MSTLKKYKRKEMLSNLEWTNTCKSNDYVGPSTPFNG